MSIKFVKKIYTNEEYLLTELLNLKRKLENSFLNNVEKISLTKLKFRIKGFIITKSFNFLIYNKTAKLIRIIEKKLKANFSNFKNEEMSFRIEKLGNSKVNSWPSFFGKLISFNKELEQYNSHLLVQGSYADNTYISYSDVDLVIVGYLSNEIIKIKNRIESFLLTVDPLQHHGVFFINKNSFLNYWQMDLPIETLKLSRVLSTTSSIKVEMQSSFVEKYSSLNWIDNFFKEHIVLPINKDTGVFFSKYFFSQVLMVPPLILATKGEYVYKRESFSIAQEFYSLEAWNCIVIASKIRDDWNQQEVNSYYYNTRKDIKTKQVKELRKITDVVNIDKIDLDILKTCYNKFRKETQLIIQSS